MGRESFIRFEVIEVKRKTKVYGVFSVHHGNELGRVFWYGAWRQYVFQAEPGTVWSCGCLQAVEVFLRDLRLDPSLAMSVISAVR
jgi:hypothetical protein